MSRSIILAILAFGLLIVANMAVFGLFGLGTLSQRMVTERLIEELNEASYVASQEARKAYNDGNYLPSLPPSASRDPQRYRGFVFVRHVVWFNEQGQVVRRALLTSRGLVPVKNEPPPKGAAQPMRMVPVSNSNSFNEPQMALEYDESAIRQEVESLRGEFYRNMWVAVGLSLLLLSAGLAYVILSYRRNKKLQEQALKADRLAYVGTLSSGLAHEIRNPLNSMNINVQLIEEELEDMGVSRDSELREMLEGTRREVGRLERLVSSFLAYARPTKLETRPLNVNDVVRETLTFLDPEIREQAVTLRTHFDENLPPVHMDGNQMKQALINVIQNGVHVLQSGQLMEITTRRAGGDKVLVIIRDEGPGISPEELKNIFKEFYSTRIGGTGLGLPIAQRIAELHRGGIKVESDVGKGTSFTFILPLEPEET
ncbi:MAG: ATP-binding protein [Acidobacteriota bacterium]|nr:ATP-binding protein [Acidobacteriota bacterium]